MERLATYVCLEHKVRCDEDHCLYGPSIAANPETDGDVAHRRIKEGGDGSLRHAKWRPPSDFVTLADRRRR
jgi:hypothetical protein